MGIIGWIVAFFINAALASVASDFASYKGFSKRAWFFTCFFLPIIGYVMIIAMPDMELHRQNEEMIELQKLLVAMNGGKRAASVDDVVNDVSDEVANEVPDPFAE